MSFPTVLPYGLRSITLYPLTGGVAGDGVALPFAQVMSFSEIAETSRIMDESGEQIVLTSIIGGTWQFQSGGVPLEATRVLLGGSITETGTTPNMKKSYTRADSSERPYFKAVGQAVSDSGGDYILTLHNCRATDGFSIPLADGTFAIVEVSGRCFPATDGRVVTFEQTEYVPPIITTPTTGGYYGGYPFGYAA